MVHARGVADDGAPVDETVAHVAASIDPSRRAVAVFDLDRTLLPGSSLALFARHAASAGLLARRDLARYALDESVFRLRGSTDRSVGSVAERALALAAGVAVADLEETTVAAARTAAAGVRPAARRLVDLHLEAGHVGVVLSASPQPLVERIAELLDLHHGIGTRLETSDGLLTGRVAGPLCYGEGKVRRLHDHAGDLTGLTIHAYADSLSDLPVLELARHPVAVGPDAALRAEAARRGWPIVDVRNRWLRRLGRRSAVRRDVRRRPSASGSVTLAGR